MRRVERALPWVGSITIIGVVCASILWLSVPSFLLLAAPTILVDTLWYSLPDGARSKPLYNFLTGASLVAALLPAALFFKLARGVERRPDRARRILPWSAAVLIVLSITWYVVGWDYGQQYQGPVFLYLNIALGVGAVFAMGALAICWRSWRSPALPMLFLWFEFAWVLGCAFPWLGETF
ncbi:hypothetical protein [Longimicrobium sp.]|jgi:hypothetical protein|uniref:hypothetical protein n=1 Tax=Longimicrobium sp. TaxID=2029185 RepID=UPI002F936D2A